MDDDIFRKPASVERGTRTSPETCAADAVIRKAHADPAAVPELARFLLGGHVHIIASRDHPQSQSFKVQDFIRDGKSFIPFFSDESHFRSETKGSGFETKGLSMDTHLFAASLRGDERLVLNPGSATPVEMPASELKSLVDPERLPKRA